MGYVNFKIGEHAGINNSKGIHLGRSNGMDLREK